MISKSPFAALVFAAAFIAESPASVQVVGVGPEQACYDASKTGKASRRGLASCDMALERSPLSPEDRAATHVNRSVLLLAARKTKAALADTDAALNIIPGMPAASVNRAAALIRLERYAEARETLDLALPAAEGRVLTRGLFNRAIASEAMGDVKSAYKDFSRIVQLDPAFEDAQLELARFQVSRH